MNRPRRAVLAIVLGFGAVLLLFGAVAALYAVPWLVERAVVQLARARGIALEPGQVRFGWGWVELTSTRATLVGVRSVEVHLGRAVVDLDWLGPKRIALIDVDGSASGSVATVALELAEWTKSHPYIYSLSVSAEQVRLRLRSDSAAPPWFEVREGTLARSGNAATFTASKAELLGAAVGPLGAGFTVESSRITMGFGEQDVARALVRVEIESGLAKPSATITLRPVDLEKLSKPFGIELPVHGVTMSGETKLAFSEQTPASPIEGEARFALVGYVPPHPVELDGFLFGDTTTVATGLEIAADRTRIVLRDTSVKAGRFELRGGGLVVTEGGRAHIELDLKGGIGCAALAGAAAGSRLGRTLGALVGAAARQALQGSVAVEVRVDADTRNLAGAKVDRRIGVGCGLQPLLSDVAGMLPGLLPDPRALASALPALASSLPAPPALGGLPGFGPAETRPAVPTGSAAKKQEPMKAPARAGQ